MTPYEIVGLLSACVTYYDNRTDPNGLPPCPDLDEADKPDAAPLSSGQAAILNLSSW